MNLGDDPTELVTFVSTYATRRARSELDQNSGTSTLGDPSSL